MEVLNAAGLTPISVHKPTNFSDRRTEPKKLSLLSSITPQKLTNSTSLWGGLAFISSVLHDSGISQALTYEDALGQSMSGSASDGAGDIDLGGVVDSFVKLGTENPAIVIGGIVILAVPLVLSQILKKPKPWGVESAKIAYAKLTNEADAQLLDIRSLKDIRTVGSPDIRSLKKKVLTIEYKGDEKPKFLDKLALKFKDPGNTTLFILDKFGGNSELVAELATVNGFKSAYAIKDGAEGPRGWKNSGLPWLEPKKLPTLDFSTLKESFGEGAEALPVTLGLVAATGLGVLAFTEIETVLQLLGSVALVQFATKKLLFAEDRKQTLKQVDEFVTTKVAPTELLDEIKMIGKALLPVAAKEKGLLPAAAEGTASTDMPASSTEKSSDTSVVNAEPKVEAATETPQINSTPRTEVTAEAAPGSQRPLSPYPSYPDLRPPTSPTPSQP